MRATRGAKVTYIDSNEKRGKGTKKNYSKKKEKKHARSKRIDPNPILCPGGKGKARGDIQRKIKNQSTFRKRKKCREKVWLGVKVKNEK